MTAPIKGEPYLIQYGKRPRLLVAFGGLMHGFGKVKAWEFMRSTAELDCYRLFVKDAGQCWHLGGSRDKFEKILDVIKMMRLSYEITRTHFVGSSSGGFGALLMGHLLKADRVDAFGPQTTVKSKQLAKMGDSRWPEVYKNAQQRRPEYHDLYAILKTWNGQTQYHIHVCQNNRVDMAHSLRLEGCPHLKVHQYPCKNHNPARWLRKRGKLQRILRGIG